MASTMKDIAKYTNLSIATISKYINGGNVLAENKILIDEAIEVLDFRVNEVARALKTNKSMTIGILIPNLEQIFCTSVVSNIENVLIQHGYSTIICDYKEDIGLEQEKLEFLVNKMVDGIIIMPKDEKSTAIQDVLDKGIEVVLIDRILENVICDVILVDNLNASYDAVEQFIVNGHQRIGIINGPKDVYTAKERLKGYRRVHEDYAMDIDEDLIQYGDYKIDSGYSMCKKLLKTDIPPTAIYVTNYEMTLGCIMALNEMGVKIPNEVSVIGFDNLQLAKIIQPPLSVVSQPMKEIGERAANLLLKRLGGSRASYPLTLRLKTNIISRGSVKKMR